MWSILQVYPKVGTVVQMYCTVCKIKHCGQGVQYAKLITVVKVYSMQNQALWSRCTYCMQN